MSYGIDIAAKRFDDLDKKIIEKARLKMKILEIGCGSGALASKLSEKECQVTAVDVLLVDNPDFTFIQGEAQTLVDSFTDSSFDIGIAQRMIHYLSYEEALELLTSLKNKVKGRLYISVSGMESEIGNHYQNNNLSIQKRFGELTQLGTELFEIEKPICLYYKKEFLELLESANWKVDEIWTSAFGNHKAICE